MLKNVRPKRFGRDSNLVSDGTIHDVYIHLPVFYALINGMYIIPSVTKLRSCLPTGHLTASPSSQLSSTTAQRRIVEHLSYAIVSDNLNNDKKAVNANNSLLMSELKQAMPWPITMVHYWSDGAASQFKNRYNFLNVAFHQRDFECNADWSFFCTSHGNGPVDGVGGEVKRAVSQQILRGNEVVSNPLDFFNVALKLAKKSKSCGSLWMRPAKSWQNWMSALSIVQSYVDHSRYTT